MSAQPLPVLLRRISPASTALALGLVLAGAVPTPASAQAPELLYACYVPKSGTVYRIRSSNAPAECVKPDHVEFSWNQQGIQGETGAQGPPGRTGTARRTGTSEDRKSVV